ncbi:MAG: hypothetical protein PHX54_10125 [Lentimicrobiaceae bacterium]|nr:hypothetical protein [Lentimicrobiaceae bacterium]
MDGILNEELIRWLKLVGHEVSITPWMLILMGFILVFSLSWLGLGRSVAVAENPYNVLARYLLAGLLSGLLSSACYLLLPGLCLTLIGVWLFFSLTGILSTTILGLFSGNWELMHRSLKIINTSFYIEQEQPFFTSIFQLISRNFWQQPQTIAGHSYAVILNSMGLIRSCDRFEDTLMISGKLHYAPGIALGNFLFAETRDEPPLGKFNLNYEHSEVIRTFRHKLGHYLQSRQCGYLYLFKIVIPGKIIQGWTEADADQRSDKYLVHEYGITPMTVLKLNQRACMPRLALEQMIFTLLLASGALYAGSYGFAGAFLIGGGIEIILNLKTNEVGHSTKSMSFNQNGQK